MATRRIGNINVNYDDSFATPTAAQTQIYNAIGRDSGLASDANTTADDNWFKRRFRSFENALGTTGASVVAGVNDAIVNSQLNDLNKQRKENQENIYKQYGFESRADYERQLDAAEDAGDDAELDRLWNLPGLREALNNQANTDRAKLEDFTNNYNDYTQNDYIGQKVNQDRGKFAGSAINTLSTTADALLMAAGIPTGALFNGAQGAIEGVADELEQNGLDKFDWQRAGVNAAVGGLAGAATGKLNSALGNVAAAKGGNLINGNNAVTKGLNKALTSNIGRGALSGAVGGATGGAVSSALNGVDVGTGIQNTLLGAGQGAIQGGATGLAMGAANKIGNTALNKLTPNTAAKLQANAQMNAAYGDNGFDQLKNAWNSGDSPVANGIQKATDKVNNLYNDFRAEGDNGFGLRYNQFSDSPDKAIDYLMKRGGGEVEGAVKNTSLETITGDGNIDLVYGKTGDDGYGLAHIAEKHGEGMLQKLPDILKNGEVYQRDGVSDRLYIKKNNDNSVVRLDWDGNKKQWVATAFETDNPASGSVGNPAAPGVGTSPVNANDTTIGSIIPQTDQNVNTRRTTEETYEQRAVNLGDDMTGWHKLAEDAGYSNYGALSNDFRRRVPDVDPSGKNIATWLDQQNNLSGKTSFLDTINPTGTAFAEYDPTFRATAPLGDDITTYDRTAGVGPAEEVTVYRGVPNGVDSINAGDYVTTNRQLAQDYAGNGRVLEQKVPASSLLDSVSEPLGEEYIYRPVDGSPETEIYRALTGDNSGNGSGNSNFNAYGESELANRTKRGMIADGLERLGNTLEGAQSNVTRATMRDLGIENAGQAIENVRKKTGLTNLETQAQFAKELTGGSDSLLDSVQRIALTASEDGKPYMVDTSKLLDDVEKIVNKYADSNTFGSREAKAKFINNLKSDISNDATDLISNSNRMKGNAADLRGKGVTSPTPADAAKAKIYTEIASKLDDLSYSAIPQENIDAMFDVASSEMRARAKQAAANATKDIARAYNKTADKLESSPRTIQAFRSFKKDFVDVSKLALYSGYAENGAAAQMGRGFGSNIKRLSNVMLERPTNALLAKAGGAINGIADKIDGNTTLITTPTATLTSATTQTYDPATQIYNTIGRTEGEIVGENVQTDKYLQDAANEAVQSASMLEGLASSQPSASSTSVYNTLTGSTSTGNSYADILGRALELAMEAGDATAFGQLYQMYSETMQNSNSGAASVSNLSAAQQAQLAKLDSADAAIDELEQLYKDAGGAQGLIGGSFQSWMGDLSLNSGVRTYNQMSEGLINQIAQAIGKTDSLNTEGEVKRALQLIPQLTDDAKTAKNKLETLRRMLQTTKASYNSAYGLAS